MLCTWLSPKPFRDIIIYISKHPFEADTIIIPTLQMKNQEGRGLKTYPRIWYVSRICSWLQGLCISPRWCHPVVALGLKNKKTKRKKTREDKKYYRCWFSKNLILYPFEVLSPWRWKNFEIVILTDRRSMHRFTRFFHIPC